ncbi:MAG TPA: alpha/beta fold hydrolase [Gemmata sp.]|nr:alpha/beta fold hydrolase [Gemmata sp.]
MAELLFLALVANSAPRVPAESAPPPRMVGEFVELKTDTGTLYGSIDLPSGTGPWPLVLIHPGSGPTDRDGNSHLSPLQVLRNDSLKMLGRALASRGIAALRIDKRGIAASAKAMGKEQDLRVETYADDAAEWIAHLRKDPRFTKIGIIGHSEGSLIVFLAAKKEKVDAIVSLCGLARPIQDVLRAQLKPALSKDLYEAADKIMTELAAGHEVPEKEMPSSLKGLFRPSVQPYLISEFKQDPAAILAKLDGPVLVISGTTDIQVPVEDGNRLAAAKPGIKHIVFDQMNHVLKRTEKPGKLEQLPLYSDPSIPLHPKLVDELAAFLKQSFGK